MWNYYSFLNNYCGHTILLNRGKVRLCLKHINYFLLSNCVVHIITVVKYLDFLFMNGNVNGVNVMECYFLFTEELRSRIQ